jgi:organic radical activating enzyme
LYFAGDLTTQPIEEIWNSDNMKNLRLQMIKGEEPEICNKCFDREKVTGESGRIYHNRDFPEVIEIIPEITKPDGTCTTMDLKYWDFRFSNLCNFKCRSCGPRYSSAWIPDARAMGLPDIENLQPDNQDKVWSIGQVGNKLNYDFLKDQIHTVQRIYFAGGEPLLMDEHWKILEMLVENKRFDVKLAYNTNCSMLTYGKKNVMDYWAQWEWGKIEVWPSIDELGPRAELIRSGTVWHKVEKNLKDLTTLKNIILRPGITVGAWNVFRLPEIIRHLVDIGVIIPGSLQYKNFFINLLESPKWYHVHILSDEHRADTIKKLNSFIKEHNAKYDTDLSHLFTHILHELEKPRDMHSVAKFLQITDQVDNIRNENLFEVIPELGYLREGL